MNKQRKGRSSASGQYIDPLLNELEWIGEEADELPVAVKRQRQARKRGKQAPKTNVTDSEQPAPTGSKQKIKKRTSQTVKINDTDHFHPPQGEARRIGTAAPPLLLLERPKTKVHTSSWAQALQSINPWAAEKAEEIVDAIQSFQLGLDGIIKTGEELKLFPRRGPVVIDVTPEERPEWKWEPKNEAAAAAESVSASWNTVSDAQEEVKAAESEADVQAESAEKGESSNPVGAVEQQPKQQQLYGLLPFRFRPYDEWLDITVQFEQPFMNEHYALVATVNRPGCHTILREKRVDSAVIRLFHNRMEFAPEGELNWIAFGETVPEDQSAER